MPSRAVYPVTEVTQLLGGVSERYVWDLIAKNILGSIKVGKRRMVPAEDIRAYIQQLRAEDQLARTAASTG